MLSIFLTILLSSNHYFGTQRESHACAVTLVSFCKWSSSFRFSDAMANGQSFVFLISIWPGAVRWSPARIPMFGRQLSFTFVERCVTLSCQKGSTLPDPLFWQDRTILSRVYPYHRYSIPFCISCVERVADSVCDISIMRFAGSNNTYPI